MVTQPVPNLFRENLAWIIIIPLCVALGHARFLVMIALSLLGFCDVVEAVKKMG